MPHFALVIADPSLANAKEIERNVRAHVAAAREALPGEPVERLTAAVEAKVRAFVGAPRQVDDLHTHMPSECPDGQPNCRNCGDPVFAASCDAAGHCRACGTRHGIAPDAVLAANGYALVEVTAPADGDAWDRRTRRFVKGARGGV